MSSYINFYLIPKKDKINNIEIKPLRLMSYSRGSDVYCSFKDNLTIPYAGNEDKYTDLTEEMVSDACSYLLDDIKKAENRYNNVCKATGELTNLNREVYNSFIEDATDTLDYIKDLKIALNEVDCILNIVRELKYSHFEKMVINIT